VPEYDKTAAVAFYLQRGDKFLNWPIAVAIACLGLNSVQAFAGVNWPISWRFLH